MSARFPRIAVLPPVALAFFALDAESARGETWPVSEYRQIQETIESAEYGDTVLVAPGTYSRLVLRPGIRLIAKAIDDPLPTLVRPMLFLIRQISTGR